MFARTQDGTLLAARLLLAAALLPTGILRALNVSGFALTLAGAGVPAPNAMATAAVVVQVFGPIAVILGVLPRISGGALALFSVATACLLHPFWLYSGIALAAERTLMLADLGLAGGFLIYGLAGPGAWSWQGWRDGALGAAPAARRPSAAARPAGAKAGGAKRGAGRAPARAAA